MRKNGARAFTATSGPGVSLMSEFLGLAYFAELPVVLVNVQRSGPSTGQPTEPAQGDMMQARWGTHGDHELIVLAPGVAGFGEDPEIDRLILSSFDARYITATVLGRALGARGEVVGQGEAGDAQQGGRTEG